MPGRPEQNFLSRLAIALLRRLPKNKYGDYIFSMFRFILTHRRFPKNESYNDIMFRIKVSDELLDPLRVFVTDKEYVKFYIEACVGKKYNVPTLAVLRNSQDIDAYEFPESCCIKPTHLSNRTIFRRNGEEIDIKSIHEWLSKNYYAATREVNYRTLRGKIIVEPLIFDEVAPADYKFFCVGGKVRVIQFDHGRFDSSSAPVRIFFDPTWKKYDFSVDLPLYQGNIERPDNFEEMMHIAEKVSCYFSHIRVDMYSDGSSCFVGELTNLSGGVQTQFVPPHAEWQYCDAFFGDKARPLRGVK